MSTERLQGVCKWFDSKKGFGFVAADGKDYFVHYKAIAGTGFKNLEEGQKVSFLVKRGDKGLLADQVLLSDSH